jgi:adenylate kinase family enzyme
MRFKQYRPRHVRACHAPGVGRQTAASSIFAQNVAFHFQEPKYNRRPFFQMKLHILGASGSGVTTLGYALSAKLGFPYFDTDDYFWEPSSAPFTVRRNPDIRNQLLASHLSAQKSWILGGSSVITWGEQWRTAFDWTVFLWLPPEIRMKRLHDREYERYGDIIFTDKDRNRQYMDFIEWAAGYDNNTARGSRTLAFHEKWLAALPCPVLEIRGDVSVEERVSLVYNAIIQS